MKSKPPLPGKDATADLLNGLLDGVTLTVVEPGEGWNTVATYVTDDDELVAVCVAELGLAAACGTALGMIPAATVEGVIRSGSLPENLGENFREVMNICAKLLCSDETPHVRLLSLHHSPDDASEEVRQLIAAPRERTDLEVEISEYGKGRLAFLVA